MIDDASTFIKTVGPAAGKVVSVYAGGVNDLEVQSFKKNPIVLATGGSVGGIITTLLSFPFPPEVPEGDFLQDAMLITIIVTNTAWINNFVFIDFIYWLTTKSY